MLFFLPQIPKDSGSRFTSVVILENKRYAWGVTKKGQRSPEKDFSKRALHAGILQEEWLK